MTVFMQTVIKDFIITIIKGDWVATGSCIFKVKAEALKKVLVYVFQFYIHIEDVFKWKVTFLRQSTFCGGRYLDSHGSWSQKYLFLYKIIFIQIERMFFGNWSCQSWRFNCKRPLHYFFVRLRYTTGLSSFFLCIVFR